MNSAAHPVFPTGGTALVTGATGFTGQVLVKKLLDLGLNVRAIARASSDRSPLEHLNIHWFTGEVFAPELVDAATSGVDYVFHVAAAYRQANLTDKDYQDVHETSTRLLAAAALKNAGFKRFVHVSTVGVHGHITRPPADETAAFNPGDAYQKTKAQAESWLHGFAREHGLPYTVLRPAAIYGPGDRRLLKLFRMATWPVFILLGRGKCLYHLIHVDDLSDILIRAAIHPAALGEAFICGNPQSVTLEEIGRTVAQTMGRHFRTLRLPAWPFFAAAALCETACQPFGLNPPLYRRRVAFFTKDRSFDTKKLRSLLGYQVRHDNRSGIEATAAWYREHGWLK